MHGEQAVLFLAVAALALALVVVVVAPKLRARGAAGNPRQLPEPPVVEGPNASPVSFLVCPTCKGRYALGLRYCPVDAQRLVASIEVPSEGRGARTCPICHRAFAIGNRFCPFDAGPLVPATSAAIGAANMIPATVQAMGLGGKICPTCARRFGSEATSCGRDGSPLVSVN
jgi:uncharacterized protein YbaR (Trm112 family)